MSIANPTNIELDLTSSGFQSHQIEDLISVVQQLAEARDLQTVIGITRQAARRLTGADGATFVLKDETYCFYVDEDAISPLWKGQRFPMSMCISGWVMQNRQAVAIENIYADSRIPAEAYRPTFVKSLVMVPIRSENPVGAIGNYWAESHQATSEELRLLQALADSTSIALENVQLIKQLNESFEKTKKSANELERQLLLRDEFIAVAAHEFNTPLTALYLQIRMFQRMIDKKAFEGHPAEQRLCDFILLAQRQVSQLSSLVSSLLDVSRIHLERFDFTLQKDVDLKSLLETLIGNLQSSEMAPIELRVLGDSIIKQGDPIRLGQAASNLILNAKRYGEGKPIFVSLSSTQESFLISVEDQGMGVAECDQERIFQRFERAVSAKHFGGMGLGLYIARKIIEGHGGRIDLKSQVGQGSTFIITLPRDCSYCSPVVSLELGGAE